MPDDAPLRASPAADAPPDSDPYAPIPEANLSPAERSRRGALLFRADLREIIDSVCKANLHGRETIADAVNRTEEGLMAEPDFPTAEEELAPFVRRVAERMAKRVQRKRELEKNIVFRPTDIGRVSSQAPPGMHDLLEREDLEAAMEAALNDAKGTRAFDMLYARVILRKSPDEIAAQFNVKVATYHALTGRLKTRLRNSIASLLAIVFAILGLRAYVDGRTDVAHRERPDAGSYAYNEALALLKDAEKACDLGDWKQCGTLLEQAAAADSTIQQRDTWKTLRAAADKGLTPVPPAPVPPPVNNPKAPAPDNAKGPGR